MIDDEDRAPGGLFYDLETEFLTSLTGEICANVAMSVLKGQDRANGVIAEHRGWLDLIATMWTSREPVNTESDLLRPALSAWLDSAGGRWPWEATLSPPRSAVVANLKSFFESFAENQSRLSSVIPFGFQSLLLAYYQGPRSFQGIKGTSSLLPQAVLEATVGTVRVPYGQGTVSWMTKKLSDWKPGNAGKGVCQLRDAGLDPAGRVAAQDFISGNRSVIGFPLFRGRTGAGSEDKLTGFFFLTHPLPGVFEDEKVQGLVDKLREDYAPHLSDYCRICILEDLVLAADRYRAVARKGWIQISIPERDWLGLHAIQRISGSGFGYPVFGLNESALVAAQHASLSQIAVVAAWTQNWRTKLDKMALECARNDQVPFIAPSLNAELPQEVPSVLTDALKGVDKWINSPAKDGKEEDLVFPVLRPPCNGADGKCERNVIIAMMTLRAPLDGRLKKGGDPPGYAKTWADLASTVRALHEQLTASLRNSEGRFDVLKRVEDAWGMVAQYVLRSTVDGLTPRELRDDHPSEGAEDSDALSVVANAIADLEFVDSEGRRCTPSLGDLGARAQAFSASLGPLTADVLARPVITFWSTLWAPVVDSITGDTEALQAWARLVLRDPSRSRVKGYKACNPIAEVEAGREGAISARAENASQAGESAGAEDDAQWDAVKVAWTRPAWTSKGTLPKCPSGQSCAMPLPALSLRPVAVTSVPRQVGRQVFQRASPEERSRLLGGLSEVLKKAHVGTRREETAGGDAAASRTPGQPDRPLDLLWVAPFDSTEAAEGKPPVGVVERYRALVLDGIRGRIRSVEEEMRNGEKRSVTAFRVWAERVLEQARLNNSKLNMHNLIQESSKVGATEIEDIRRAKRWFLGCENDEELFSSGLAEAGKPIAVEAFKEVVGVREQLTSLGAWLLAWSAYRNGTDRAATFLPRDYVKKTGQKFVNVGADAVKASPLPEAFYEMCSELFYKDEACTLHEVRFVEAEQGAPKRFDLVLGMDLERFSVRLQERANVGWSTNEDRMATTMTLRFLSLCLLRSGWTEKSNKALVEPKGLPTLLEVVEGEGRKKTVMRWEGTGRG